MENNIDDALTASVKKRINSMKPENGKPSSSSSITVVELLTLLTVAIAKYASLSLLAWWGWSSCAIAFGFPEVSYLQTISILVLIRSIKVVMVDPITNLQKKNEQK